MSKNGMVELIKEIGNDNIEFQLVNQSIVDVKKMRDCNKVSFLTNQITPNDAMQNSGKVGVIVWVDRCRYMNALSEVSKGLSK